MSRVLAGSGGDYTVTLQTGVAVQLPEAANSLDGDYVLVITNNSGTDAFFRVTSGITGGTLLENKDVLTVEMRAGEVGYVYQTSGSNKTINYTVKEVEFR